MKYKPYVGQVSYLTEYYSDNFKLEKENESWMLQL